MQTPLQITFRDMEPSAAVEANIREKAGKLEQFYDRIMSCRVVVEVPHGHQHQGRLYQVRIVIVVESDVAPALKVEPEVTAACATVAVVLVPAIVERHFPLEVPGRDEKSRPPVHAVRARQFRCRTIRLPVTRATERRLQAADQRNAAGRSGVVGPHRL